MFCIECGDAQTDLSLHWVHKHAHRKCCVQAHILLTLKAPRKTASENVVCLCRLLNILANFIKPTFAYRQTVWTQIRLLLKEQSDLGPHSDLGLHCLQK